MALAKFDATAFFGTVIADADDAKLIAGKAVLYIQAAQQIGAAWGLTGSQKLTAVLQWLQADLNGLDPNLGAWFAKALPQVTGVINGLVAIFNTIGWLFQAAAPIVAAADPGAAPAIAAINAAIDAGKAISTALSAPSTSLSNASTSLAAVSTSLSNLVAGGTSAS